MKLPAKSLAATQHQTRIKKRALQPLREKWKSTAQFEVTFWNKYNFKLNPIAGRVELAASQPPDRDLISVLPQDWKVLVESERAAYSEYDPQFAKEQERLNQAAIKNDARAYKKHLKNLALRDAKYRVRPDWMNEKSFTQAVSIACQENDGNFFLKLGKILRTEATRGIQHDELTLFLLDNYILGTPPDGVFLAIFSDNALAHFVVAAKVVAICNEQMLKKARQRLKLTKLPSPILQKIKVQKGQIIASK